MEINERIFYLLSIKNRTAKDLADYIGISQSSVSAWKNEGSYPSSKYIIRISEFFETSIAFLFTGNDLESPKNNIRLNKDMPTKLSSEDKLWLDLVHTLPSELRENCYIYVQGFIAGSKNSDTPAKKVMDK